MTKKRLGKGLLTVLAAVWAACLVLWMVIPAWAAVPQRPANKYVLDEAGVLSDKTEKEIIEENNELFREYGAEVVVVTVDFLGGQEIDDYAYSLFNDWGIGSSQRDNGILLVLAIGEDNYYATSGYGLEDYFDGAKFRELLNDYLETPFSLGEYDEGVALFFEEVVDELEDYYEHYEDEYTQAQEDGYGHGYSGYQEYSRPSLWSRVANIGSAVLWVIVRVVILIAVILVIASLFGRGRGGRGGPPYGGGGGGGFFTGMLLGNMMGRRRTWGPPPPPPPPGGFRGPGPGGFGGPRPGGSRPGGFGGFTGGGRSGGIGGGRGGFGGGGGFTGGGGTHGGGAGRR